jgi:RNA polymerase sigma factor (sigma-70 family)
VAERDGRWQTINGAIAALAEDERRILWLHDAQNLTLREIGEALGLDELTVEHAYVRAREQVNARLREAGYEELRWEPPLPPSLE